VKDGILKIATIFGMGQVGSTYYGLWLIFLTDRSMRTFLKISQSIKKLASSIQSIRKLEFGTNKRKLNFALIMVQKLVPSIIFPFA
jgi:hypothetical protein